MEHQKERTSLNTLPAKKPSISFWRKKWKYAICYERNPAFSRSTFVIIKSNYELFFASTIVRFSWLIYHRYRISPYLLSDEVWVRFFKLVSLTTEFFQQKIITFLNYNRVYLAFQIQQDNLQISSFKLIQVESPYMSVYVRFYLRNFRYYFSPYAENYKLVVKS